MEAQYVERLAVANLFPLPGSIESESLEQNRSTLEYLCHLNLG